MLKINGIKYSRPLIAGGVKSWISSLKPGTTCYVGLMKEYRDRDAIARMFTTFLILGISYVE